MIPQFDADIRQQVRLDQLGYPAEDVLACQDGLLANRDYIDWRGAPWDFVFQAYDAEMRLIAEADKQSTTAEEFEELLVGFEDDWGLLEADLPFDIGVNSSVLAVSALGCAPVSSCRYHLNRGGGDTPYVTLWAREREARIIKDVAKRVKVGALNEMLNAGGGILVFSNSVMGMMDFSKALYDGREGWATY
jgi:hypothetical protein